MAAATAVAPLTESESELGGDIARLIAGALNVATIVAGEDVPEHDVITHRFVFKLPQHTGVTFPSECMRELYALNQRVLDVTVHVSISEGEYMLVVTSNREVAQETERGAALRRFSTGRVPEVIASDLWVKTRKKVNNNSSCSLCLCVGMHMQTLLSAMLGVPEAIERTISINPDMSGVYVVFYRITVPLAHDEYQVSIRLLNMLYGISRYVDHVAVTVEATGDEEHIVAVNVHVRRLKGNEREDWLPFYSKPAQKRALPRDEDDGGGGARKMTTAQYQYKHS